MWWLLVPHTFSLYSSIAVHFYMVPSLKNRINFGIASIRKYQILSAYTSEFPGLKFALRYPVWFLKESQFLKCLYIKNAVLLHCTYIVELLGIALELFFIFYVPNFVFFLILATLLESEVGSQTIARCQIELEFHPYLKAYTCFIIIVLNWGSPMYK